MKYFFYGLVALAATYLLIAFMIPLTAKYTPVCGLCHAVRTEYASSAHSSHSDLGCLDCHSEPGIGGKLAVVFKAAGNISAAIGGTFTNRSSVGNDTCISCHPRVNDDISVRSKIRVSHREIIAAGWKCTQCHGEVGHKLTILDAKIMTPSMDKCFRCHKGKKMSKCSLCHIGKPKSMPIDLAGSGTLTHNRNWARVHGAGDLHACNNCHKPNDCKTCHLIPLPHNDDWPKNHSKTALSTPTSCIKCHQAKFCFDCHKIKMPHPRPYIHAKQAKLLANSCRGCHYQTDCSSCHNLHLKHRQKRQAKP